MYRWARTRERSRTPSQQAQTDESGSSSDNTNTLENLISRFETLSADTFQLNSPPPSAWSRFFRKRKRSATPPATGSPSRAGSAHLNEEDYTCALCLSLLHRPVRTICNHIFCQGCLKRWFEVDDHLFASQQFDGKPCPLCRRTLWPDALEHIDERVELSVRRIKTNRNIEDEEWEHVEGTTVSGEFDESRTAAEVYAEDSNTYIVRDIDGEIIQTPSSRTHEDIDTDRGAARLASLPGGWRGSVHDLSTPVALRRFGYRPRRFRDSTIARVINFSFPVPPRLSSESNRSPSTLPGAYPTTAVQEAVSQQMNPEMMDAISRLNGVISLGLEHLERHLRTAWERLREGEVAYEGSLGRFTANWRFGEQREPEPRQFHRQQQPQPRNHYSDDNATTEAPPLYEPPPPVFAFQGTSLPQSQPHSPNFRNASYNSLPYRRSRMSRTPSLTPPSSEQPYFIGYYGDGRPLFVGEEEFQQSWQISETLRANNSATAPPGAAPTSLL
ncbi:hypothetical protein HDU85_001282 [Gaertneriomyces sp. JEL0708]|nr:hypothetical protein HDU85_001282 [Gaertneriomyces sp. JEL0708]